LTRTSLQLLALAGLIFATVWIIRPFIPAILWAVAITVATWPLLLALEARLGSRRSLAVAVMTIGLLLLVVAPLYLTISTIVERVDILQDWSRRLSSFTVPAPPDWLQTIPLIGPRLSTRWSDLAAAGPEVWRTILAPFTHSVLVWFLRQAGSLGLLLVNFLVTVVFCAILYANGEGVAATAVGLARRLAGPEGEKAAHLAAMAVRGVALGIIVAAVIQAILAGVGLSVAGVPFAGLLTALMLILAIAQVGPAPVLIPAVIWVYVERGGIWGTALLVWALVCMTFDNVLRPLLIKQSADIPLILIFVGVIGGLLALGVIGIFVGPVVLAVAHTLFVDWVMANDSGLASRT